MQQTWRVRANCALFPSKFSAVAQQDELLLSLLLHLLARLKIRVSVVRFRPWAPVKNQCSIGKRIPSVAGPSLKKPWSRSALTCGLFAA